MTSRAALLALALAAAFVLLCFSASTARLAERLRVVEQRPEIVVVVAPPVPESTTTTEPVPDRH